MSDLEPEDPPEQRALRAAATLGVVDTVAGIAVALITSCVSPFVLFGPAYAAPTFVLVYLACGFGCALCLLLAGACLAESPPRVRRSPAMGLRFAWVALALAAISVTALGLQMDLDAALLGKLVRRLTPPGVVTLCLIAAHGWLQAVHGRHLRAARGD